MSFRHMTSFCNKMSSAIFNKLKFLKAIKLCDFKMYSIKWQLNFLSCNFVLKSYLCFQIERARSASSILKSRVWFQTKLHSTQFNYHYELKTFTGKKKDINKNEKKQTNKQTNKLSTELALHVLDILRCIWCL